MANKKINTRILLKRDTYANWNEKNPILSSGEYSYDTTNKIIKVGDGISNWNNLDSIHITANNVDGLNAKIAELGLELSGIISGEISSISSVANEAKSTATAANTNANEAKTAAAIVATDLNALSTKVGELPTGITSTTVVGYVDERIASLPKGMNFRGVVEDLNAISDPMNGDIAILSGTAKEFVYSAEVAEKETTGWVELGDESAWDVKGSAAAALAAAKTYADTKTTKELTSTVGKSMIFNETDGGGAKFENVDNTWSYVGVNNGGKNGIAAQVYAVDSTNGYAGAKLDVSTNGMYYTVGNKTATERMIPANEVATKGNVDEVKALANTKTTTELSSTAGTSYIWNEASGGGARFVNNNGIESFVGVNNGEGGLVAQIYADKYEDGKWNGAKFDVSNNGMYYTIGNKTATERMIPANEIATKGDVSAIITDIVFDCGDSTEA